MPSSKRTKKSNGSSTAPADQIAELQRELHETQDALRSTTQALEATHNEGFGANWRTRRASWLDRATHEAALRTNLLEQELAARAEWQHREVSIGRT